MGRFLRGPADRILLWQAAHGRCQRCGMDLPPAWHADHIIPWRRTQRTNIHEMQALCPTCNRTKGATLTMDLAKARTGQKDAIEVIEQRIRSGQSWTAGVLPTGYGKSDVIRVSAVDLWEAGFTCCSVILSPTAYLRDQIVNADKLLPSLLRYRLYRSDIKYAAIKTLSVNYAANGECLFSATMQLVQNNVEHFAQWIDAMVQRTRLPVLVYIDETHTSTHTNNWGAAMNRLEASGARMICLTATNFRDDDAQIVGFDKELVESEPITVTKTRPGSKPEYVTVQIWEGTKHHYVLKPHFHTTFREAWRDKIICNIAHRTFDVSYNKATEDLDAPGTSTASSVLLSDMSKTETRRVLGKLVRHPLVIHHGVKELIHWLTRFQRMQPACAGIVFTANDDSDESNEHAEKIKAEIRSLKPQWKVMIATSADVEGRGKDTLEQFVAHEQGDILIVKQMAGLGLDSPRLKVVLDLSPFRTPTSFIQRVNRATRPYEGILTAYLITPADILSLGCFTELIDSEGGAATQEIELIREYEKPKEESPLFTYALKDIHPTDIHDTKGMTARIAMIERIVAFYELMPEQVGVRTPGEVETILTHWPQAQSEEPSLHEPRNTGDEAKRLRDEVVRLCKASVHYTFVQKTGRPYHGQKDDQQKWEEISKAAYREAYNRVHVPYGTTLSQINDVTVLERLRSYFDAVFDGASA